MTVFNATCAVSSCHTKNAEYLNNSKNLRYCVVPSTEKYHNFSVLSLTFHDTLQHMASRENQFVKQNVFRKYV
jgi:hypothetical protein